MRFSQKNLPLVPLLLHVGREAFLYEEELKSLPYEQYRVKREDAQTTLREIKEKYPQALYFVAGSVSFVGEIEAFLHSIRVGPSRIFKDPFKGLLEDK